MSKYAEVSGGVTLGRKLDCKSTIELPYLRVANVQDGYLDLDEMKTVEVLKSEAGKYKLQPGNIVMTESGGFDKLGRGTIWEGQIAGCLHQNLVFRVQAKLMKIKSVLMQDLLTGKVRVKMDVSEEVSANA